MINATILFALNNTQNDIQQEKAEPERRLELFCTQMQNSRERGWAGFRPIPSEPTFFTADSVSEGGAEAD